MNDSYDIILIGSGMGALTVASLMTQLRDKRVLVLEKHFRPGGYTHDFKRGRFHFGTGLHYVGKMHEGSMTRRMIDLITGGKVNWTPMPDPFDKFIYPDLRFEVYSDPERTITGLCDLFPDESQIFFLQYPMLTWLDKPITTKTARSIATQFSIKGPGSAPLARQVGEL